MTTTTSDIAMPSPQSLLTALKTFIPSPRNFQILHSIPHGASLPAAQPPQTLYILDSSFNPPTLAHLRICESALHDDPRAAAADKRLLLLLATQNADKPAKPAAFEQRLKMMCLLAQDLRTRRGKKETAEEGVPIDIGVTKLPIFVDKVKEIADPDIYGEQVEQVHLIGFDTLVRLMDTKYYPPQHTLQPLETLFGKHRVRVTRRTDDKWGGREEQDAYIQALAQGQREEEGGKRVWAEKIDLVEGRREGDEVVSSTKVREAIGRSDRGALQKMVAENIASWILEEELYNEDG